MAKFRYYIVTESGDIYGTNNPEIAQEFADSSADYVIDTEENKTMFASAEVEDIAEIL